MAALLWLQFEQKHGETLARPRQQDPPWRMVRAFQNSEGEALAHLHNVSGGVLDSDDLRLRVEVGPNARVQLTTTGATRVYRSRSPEAIARQRVDAIVGEGAMLEYLPDPVIPFAHARLRQETSVQLHDGATLFWWETVAPGREASGEVFAYHTLRNSFELVADRRVVAIERFTIEPRLRDPASAARMGQFRHFSTFYVCQPGRSRQSWLQLEAELGDLAFDISQLSGTLWGVSTLADCGLVIRGVSLRSRDLTQGLLAFWRAAKWSLCGRVAAIPRKIY
jgi:urease accessory protein